jgi:PAS domain-containing protein
VRARRRRLAAPSIRGLLASLAMSAWLLPTALAFGLVWQAWQDATATAEASALQAARRVARDADGRFLQLKSGLDALASSPAVPAGDLDTLRLHARSFLAANASVFNITMVDASGEQVLNTASTGDARLKAHADILALFQGGSVAITGIFEGRVIPRPLIAVAVPARVNGQVWYTVAAGLSPASFGEVLLAAREAGPATVSLLDPSGRLVARSAPQKPLEVPLAHQDAAEGVLRTRATDGTPVIAAWRRAALSRYLAVVSVPESIVLAPAQQRAGTTALVLLLAAVASLGVALRVGARIAAGVRALAHPGGAGAAPPPAVFRESEQVRAVLDAMAADLQRARREGRALRKALQERRIANLEALIDATEQPMLVADGEGRLLAINAAGSRVFGYTRQQAAGLALDALFRGDPAAGGPGTGIARDGSEFPLRARSTAFVVRDLRYLVVAFRPAEAPDAPR